MPSTPMTTPSSISLPSSNPSSNPNGTLIFIIACAIVFGCLAIGTAVSMLVYRVRQNLDEEDPAMPSVNPHFDASPPWKLLLPRLLNFGKPVPVGSRLWTMQMRMADKFQREEDDRLEKLCVSYHSKYLGHSPRHGVWENASRKLYALFVTPPSELKVFKARLRAKLTPRSPSASPSFGSPRTVHWLDTPDNKAPLESTPALPQTAYLRNDSAYPSSQTTNAQVSTRETLPFTAVVVASQTPNELHCLGYGPLPIAPSQKLLKLPLRCDRLSERAEERNALGLNLSHITGSRFCLAAPPLRKVSRMGCKSSEAVNHCSHIISTALDLITSITFVGSHQYIAISFTWLRQLFRACDLQLRKSNKDNTTE